MGSKSGSRFAITVVIILLAAFPRGAQASTDAPQSLYTVPHVQGQVLVKRAPGIPATLIEQLLVAYGGTLLDFSADAGLDVVGISDDAELEAAIAVLRADPGIEYAEPNYLAGLWATPNDINFPQQWSRRNSGLNAPSGLGYVGADMNLVPAWDTRTTAPGVLVAIIDDSLETSHVDLAGNIGGSGKCFASPGSPRPCVNGPDDPNPVDAGDFHGTLVAGTAAARGNNGIGVAGAVWETNLLPLKVDLSYYAIVNAVDEAIAQGADIINMSFGGPVPSQALSDAIARAESAGILIVAAAGNADASNDIASHYPSNEQSDNVVAVAATDSRDRVASFSQWGATSVHIAAPGDLVLTTANGDSYATVSGTSFSAPNVSGVAALIFAETGATDYARVRAHLLNGTVNGRDALGPVTPGQDKQAVPGRTATGRLDADLALADPAGGVVIVSEIRVNDAVTGNGNARLDPGETAELQVTLRNTWSDESGVSGTLTSIDSGTLAVNELAPVVFGDIARDGSATAAFGVTLSPAVEGNVQLMLQLDLASTSTGTLATRYFYIEVGALRNGETLTQGIQRYDWDEFQAFNVDVPAGASSLDVVTSGSGDIDLLVRYQQSPEYLITLNAAPGAGFYYVDSESRVSAGATADESVSYANPLPGTYHVVVVNFDQQSKAYDITASYDLPTAGEINFTQATYTAAESAGVATITVTRSGAVGGAVVRYSTADETATAGNDYVASSGFLVWGLGENGPKTFDVPILDDQAEELTETLRLDLSDVNGSTLGATGSAVLEITDDDSVGGVLALGQAGYSVSEGAGLVTIDVVRSGGSTGQVTVDYATQNGQAVAGTDFQATSGTLTWADGDGAAKTFTVTLQNDAAAENLESFTVVLANAQGALLGAPASATVGIIDDDVATSGSGGGGGRFDRLTLLLLLALLAIRHSRGPSPARRRYSSSFPASFSARVRSR